ncbi:MAG: hypothetical protein WCI17_11835 [bacterium]
MRRFFSDQSYWNIPIPAHVPIDPESQVKVELLAQMRPEGFWINHTSFTIPVFEATPKTPCYQVHRRIHWNSPFRRESLAAARTHLPEDFPLGHGPGFGNDVPIPDEAVQDPAGDQHMAIVDWHRCLAWDMWGAQRRPDGQWESKTGMVYPLDGPGVFDRAWFDVRDRESIHLYGPSRAAGVPAIAGLILQAELAAERIDHKLAFGSSAVALQQFVYPPACWTDGSIPGGLPEGAVLQLDPHLDLSRLSLSPAGRTIARALQVYGAVCVDFAGGNVIYAEGLYGHRDRSWKGLLDAREIESLGYQHFRVLDMGRTIPFGDDGHPVWPAAARALPAAAERAKIRPWPFQT